MEIRYAIYEEKICYLRSEHYLLMCVNVCVKHIRRKLGFKQMICDVVDCFDLAQDKDKWRVVVNTVIVQGCW
jgi:hypothetical protein